MAAVLSNSSYADELEPCARDAGCCAAVAPCARCLATLAELRAARRDALIHAVAGVRPRRVRR